MGVGPGDVAAIGIAACCTGAGSGGQARTFAVQIHPHANGTAGRAVGGVLFGSAFGGQQVNVVVGFECGVFTCLDITTLNGDVAAFVCV